MARALIEVLNVKSRDYYDNLFVNRVIKETNTEETIPNSSLIVARRLVRTREQIIRRKSVHRVQLNPFKIHLEHL